MPREPNQHQTLLTLSLSEGQIVMAKKRWATMGSKQIAMDKIMVSHRYGCLRAFGAVPRHKQGKNESMTWSFNCL